MTNILIAKDINTGEIPNMMFRGKEEINEEDVSECFSDNEGDKKTLQYPHQGINL